MSHEYISGVYFLQNYSLDFLVISANTSTPCIVGLAYFKLGKKYVNVIMSATIPNNTAVILTLFDAYRRHSRATINIAGPGRKNVKIIIWSTFEDPLDFTSNLVHKRISYAGYEKSDVNKVAKKEFGREADVVYSSFKSPGNISVFYSGKY